MGFVGSLVYVDTCCSVEKRNQDFEEFDHERDENRS